MQRTFWDQLTQVANDEERTVMTIGRRLSLDHVAVASDNLASRDDVLAVGILLVEALQSWRADTIL